MSLLSLYMVSATERARVEGNLIPYVYYVWSCIQIGVSKKKMKWQADFDRFLHKCHC